MDAATVVARAETREELEDALVRLPVIYRTAVVLHDAEGITVAEIGDIQGVGLPAAKQRLRRGRMMMVDALEQGRERRAALRGVPLRCREARGKVSDYLDDLPSGLHEQVQLTAELARGEHPHARHTEHHRCRTAATIATVHVTGAFIRSATWSLRIMKVPTLTSPQPRCLRASPTILSGVEPVCPHGVHS